AKQFESFLPSFQVIKRSRSNLRAAHLPVVSVSRAVERGLGNADEKTHHGNPFVGLDGEVADVFATRERLMQTDGAGLTLTPHDWNPRVSRKIHRTPPAWHVARARDE